MRPVVAILVVVALALSGCAAPAPPAGADAPAPTEQPDTFLVPTPRVGDELVYHFGFQTADGIAFEGVSAVRFVGQTSVTDAYGKARDAIHMRQSNPDGTFAEDYYLDAQSLRQIRLVRADTYNATATLTPPASSPLPLNKASYANATGTLERLVFDPLFEDANSFGIFASGREIPAEGQFEITGNLWERDGTRLLISGVLPGKISLPDPSEKWGALRSLDFTAQYDGGETNQETIEWVGDFATTVPLAVSMKRTIKANFFGQVLDNTFNITLLEFKPGSGAQLSRGPDDFPQGPSGERAPWTRAPADGTAGRLAFPLSEALAALDKDPTALQYFQTHTGAYLYFAELYDVNTCRFMPSAQAPACHWLQWDGIFFAPDDWMLSFTIEKYGEESGTGAAYAPVVTRDQIFSVLFDTVGGGPQLPPEPAIVAEKWTGDLPERSVFPPDGLTVGGAVQLWKAGLTATNVPDVPNFVFIHLGPQGYSYSIDYNQWEFPPENPELFPLYDNAPLELLRHGSDILADGYVVTHRNYEVVVEHH